MLESGAMVSLLADLFPEKGLAPVADVFSLARADYLQMLHYGTSWVDMMLWARAYGLCQDARFY